MTTTKQVHNFSAGPAVLPLPVLERAQAELLDYGGTGMSVMEMSHRSAAFETVVQRAEADHRSRQGLGPDYTVLFLQGGASLQFAMVPMNLRAAGASADYVLSGHWSKAALKERPEIGPRARRRLHGVERLRPRAGPGRARSRRRGGLPALHLEQHDLRDAVVDRPRAPPGVPLVCDASSDALSRPVDVGRCGVFYAGAQKNLGPAGVTLVDRPEGPPKRPGRSARPCSTTA